MPTASAPGQKGRHADEALGTEQPADRAERAAAAEIEQIDDQEVGHAAHDRRVEPGDHHRGPPARQLGKGTERAEQQPDEEGRAGHGDGHQRGVEDLVAPAFRPEADELETGQHSFLLALGFATERPCHPLTLPAPRVPSLSPFGARVSAADSLSCIAGEGWGEGPAAGTTRKPASCRP